MTIEIFEQITDSTASYVSAMNDTNQPLLLKINSAGGSVFSAMTIYNELKKNPDVTIEILGWCASAATLIACAGRRVQMASNALFMLHAPQVMISSQVDANKLDAMKTTLQKIEESVLEIYRSRVPNFELPAGELYLHADEAKAMGFVDEIIGEVDVQMNGFNMFGRVDNRVSELTKLKCSDAAVNALIDVAIAKGKQASEVVDYVEAIKKVPRSSDSIELLAKMIGDQIKSGSMNVGESSPPTPEEIRKAQVAEMVAFANGVI